MRKLKPKINRGYRMETAAFLGMLGLGYALQKPNGQKKEGFESSTPAPALTNDYTRYESIVPGVVVAQPPLKYEAPVGVRSSTIEELDTMYNYPADRRIASEPNPGKQGGYLGFPVPTITAAKQVRSEAATKTVQFNTNGSEETPVLGVAHVSPLTGLPMKAEDFTHANMVPFFRGTPKQNMSDTANRNLLDTYTGGGSHQQEKREQGAMFDPQKEPTGVPFGSEIATDFMQGRVVAPTNRAGERPFEQVRVGRGLGKGFTANPSGGFQQASALDYARPRTTDELRTANNPKTTYKGVVVQGQHFVANRGQIGEVRKHKPDTFYINEKGERNFTTTGANLKSTERPVQVLRDTTRPETTKEYEGVAKSADFNATYTVPSTRAPMVKQAGSWGYRNADATAYFDKNVDSDQNDYGKSAIEIRPNERFYTEDRTTTLNMKPGEAGKVTLPLQDGPRQTRKDEMLGNPNQAGYVNSGIRKGPAYDPNDVARTTIKETTIDGDYVGTATGPKKLTVYNPEDVARTTIKETTGDNDYLGTAAGPNKGQVWDPTDIARTTTKETTEDNDYLGTAAGPSKHTVYDPSDTARTTIKETTIDNDYLGTAAGPGKHKIYDPSDVARTTTKETTIDNNYLGGVGGTTKGQVYDPNDTARTTTKETTIDNNYLGTVAGPVKLTIYDPDDVARTTVKETTGDNDYVGIAAPNQPQKLTIYDPEDVARTTIRNTTEDFDYNRNLGRSDNPDAPYVPFTDIARVTDREALSAVSEYYGSSNPTAPKIMVNPFVDGARLTQKASISAKSAYTGSGNANDKKALVNPYLDGARATQKASISAKSSYTGAAGTANAKAPRSENAEREMRHYPQRENVAKGRAPAGNIAIFNGEDYVNLKMNKVESDFINDRSPVVSRVLQASPSEESIGAQRPRAVLKLDVSSERNNPAIIAGLETNPYVIPLHSVSKKVSAGQGKYGKNQSIAVQ